MTVYVVWSYYPEPGEKGAPVKVFAEKASADQWVTEAQADTKTSICYCVSSFEVVGAK